jgi:hypothetical protein
VWQVSRLKVEAYRGLPGLRDTESWSFAVFLKPAAHREAEVLPLRSLKPELGRIGYPVDLAQGLSYSLL